MFVTFALQIERNKLHGCIDVGLSVMAIKKKAKCIDFDAEENIYHLKVNRKANSFKAVPTDLLEVMLNMDYSDDSFLIPGTAANMKRL